MLEVIIPYINEKIETLEMFSKFHGLCEIIKKDGKSFPAEYCKGEYKQVSDFDKSKGVVYHRLTGSISKQEAEDDTNVSCDPFYETTFPLRTVVCIDKKHLKGIGNNAYLENKIGSNLSNLLAESNNKTLRQDLRADSVIIQVEKLITNRDELFSEEYDGYEENFIRYEFLYIAIDYNVVVTGNVSCFEEYVCQ
jgi:hypothetical protein